MRRLRRVRVTRDRSSGVTRADSECPSRSRSRSRRKRAGGELLASCAPSIMLTTLAGVARRRAAAGILSRSRQLSASACRRVPDSGDSAPKPPPPIDDSTSALDYKRRTTLQHRPPPLPVIDVRSRSAEEAVTNILYNTPPPSLAPFKKCDLSHYGPSDIFLTHVLLV